MGLIFMRFPGGRAKALTLSYDDGVEQDVRLIKIMQRHGLKGTFNLNSGVCSPEGTVFEKGQIHRRMSRSQCREVYQNSAVEVAVHGLTHPFLEQLPIPVCTYEVLQDRMNLEKDFCTIVRGMAYPYGTFSDSVIDVLRKCGIAYARTVESTERFELPADWLRLPATCHHDNPRLMELARQFVETDRKRAPALFYLWGHSYEFDKNNNWNVIEEFASYIGNRMDIWYATNIEIFDYIAGYNQLIFGVDGKRVYNPTGIDLYFEVNQKIFCIKSNETLYIE